MTARNRVACGGLLGRNRIEKIIKTSYPQGLVGSDVAGRTLIRTHRLEFVPSECAAGSIPPLGLAVP